MIGTARVAWPARRLPLPPSPDSPYEAKEHREYFDLF